MTCSLLDLPCHAQNLVLGWLAAVPWWAWVCVALVVVGIVWKVAGWPGLLALAAGAGFVLGRRSADRDEPTETDIPSRDRRPPRRTKPSSSKPVDPLARREGESLGDWLRRTQ